MVRGRGRLWEQLEPGGCNSSELTRPCLPSLFPPAHQSHLSRRWLASPPTTKVSEFHSLWAFHPQGSADQQQKTLPTPFLGKNYNCVKLVLVPISGPNTRGDKDGYLKARGSTWNNRAAAITAMWRARLLQERGGILDTSGFSPHYRQ